MMMNIPRTIRRGLMAVAVPFGCAVALASCDDFLDTQPLGSLTGSTFYQTEQDFDAATLGPYSTMLNLTYDQNGLGYWNGFLMPDDDVRYRDPNNANDFFNWNAGNGDFAWVWRTAYKGIMRANVVLQQLPDATGFANENLKPRYEAEAKYMRAWWYFLLARNWGNVPLVTEVISSVDAAAVPTSAPGEVWDLIESDLEFAAQNLPPDYGGEKGRATRWTALSLLGKVEVFRAQWFNEPGKYTEAITHLSEVVNQGPYTLMPNYGDNFLEAHENNAEAVFEIQATVGDNVNAWGTTDSGTGRAAHAWEIYVSPSCYYGPNGGCAPLAWQAGYGQIEITESLQDEFEPGDPRFYYTMYSTGEQYGSRLYNMVDGDTAWWSGTQHTPAKYNRPWAESRPGNIWNSTTNNLREMRFAEVLLYLAEAELLGGGGAAAALPHINRVRQRARTTFDALCADGGPPSFDCTQTNVVPDLTTVTFADIEHERRVELATEVHRYDDLVRWHRAGLINIPDFVTWGYPDNNNWSETHLLKPIPQGELDLNPNLTQNPGY